MIAAICLLIPPLISALISEKLALRQESKLYIVVRYVIYAVILNGIIWIILRLFFTHGDRPIYNLNHNMIFAFKYIALAIALAIFTALIELPLRNIYKSLCVRIEPALIWLKEWVCHCSAQLRAISFVVILGGIFGAANFIAQPFWNSQNYNPTHGIYNEPCNTIETLFLGSSHVFAGISPMKLYEDYGICSYVLSTDSQPLMASYYWLQVIYNLHSNSLDTVVLDVSKLRSVSALSSYHMAIDPMRFSLSKVRAVKAYSENFENFIQNMLPIFSYHERWKELSELDFTKYENEPRLALRGYAHSASQIINDVSNIMDLYSPLSVINVNDKKSELDITEVQYFRELVSFCNDHELKLVLISIPTGWTYADHNAVQALADEYGLDFIDFNIQPYYSQIEYNFATDSRDALASTTNNHANYYGVLKITDYMGNYLTESCHNKDVRGEKKYAFMEDELKEYHRFIVSAELMQYTNPCDYIEYALNRGDYTIFISVKDEAADALTDEQRKYFASIGLDKLAEITNRASYLAVIEDGVVKKELYSEDPGEKNKTDTLLEYNGTMPDGTEYTITSGGYCQGNESSVKIGGIERSENSLGLNIVLYDNKREMYVDRASFDTHVSPERAIQNVELRLATELDKGATLSELRGTDRTLYLYNRRCENEMNVALTRQAVGDNDLLGYIDAFLNDDDLDIYISVKGDAASALNYYVREELAKRGLTVLSRMAYQESYVALISGGEVIFEESGHGEDRVEVKNDKYYLSSGGEAAGDTSSIIIDGTEYSLNENGMNIVIYDNVTEMVIDKITFDTGILTLVLPEEVAA